MSNQSKINKNSVFEASGSIDTTQTSSAQAMTDVLIVISGFALVKFIPGLPLSGPAAVTAGVILATILYYWRGGTWRDLGLKFPKNLRGFLKGAGLTALILISSLCVAAVLSVAMTTVNGGPVEQNLPDVSTAGSLFIMLAIVWTTAAIGEELLFRGFLMTRLADIFGRSRLGWAVALIGASAIFGMSHAYQGVAGVLLTGTVGLTYGIWYIIGKRNLLPLIFAHGLSNTIVLTALHFQTSGVLASG